jgi:hypothetical protein
MHAALASRRREPTRVATLGNARCMKTMERKVLDHLDRGGTRWIDVVEGDDGMPLYRACGQNGAVCRYTVDLWQAEIYVNYY